MTRNEKTIAALTGLAVALVAVDKAVAQLELKVGEVLTEDAELFDPDEVIQPDQVIMPDGRVIE